MPRKPRIEFAGALYHAMSRGNRGEAIFRDDRDRVRFLEALGEACEKTGWRVHAYVLMSNHYHLLLETPQPNLVAGMKWLQGTYTQRFNARHRLRGHLLQGRYQAPVVEAEGEYFGVVSTYTHLNAVRAGLVKAGERLASYRWSSYPAYVGGKRAGWLEVKRVLRSVGVAKDDRKGRSRYSAYLESRGVEVAMGKGKELEEEWKSIRRGWFVGSEEFREGLLARVGKVLRDRRRESLSGEEVREHRGREAEEELKWALRVLGWRKGSWESGAKGSEEKAVLAWWLRKRTVAGRRWVAERLGMGYETRVTAASGMVERARRGRLWRWRRALEQGAGQRR